MKREVNFNEALCYASRQELKWIDNVAFGCNFTTNENLKTIKTSQDDCQKNCISTYGCSHFVWSDNQGGTCSMKKNAVSAHSVIASSAQNSFCGIVDGKNVKNKMIFSALLFKETLGLTMYNRLSILT